MCSDGMDGISICRTFESPKVYLPCHVWVRSCVRSEFSCQFSGAGSRACGELGMPQIPQLWLKEVGMLT